MTTLGKRSTPLVLAALWLSAGFAGCAAPDDATLPEEEGPAPHASAAIEAAQVATAADEELKQAEADLRKAQERVEEARRRAEQTARERQAQAERERAEAEREQAEREAALAVARAEEARKRADEARKRAEELAGGAKPSAPVPTASVCTVPPRSTSCTDKLAPGDERLCRIGGRSYTIRAGKTYDPCKPGAVVFDLPSITSNARHLLGRETYCLGSVCWSGLGSGWAQESDTAAGGFIVVVPDRASTSDYDFLRQVQAEVKRVANVDSKKVFLSGIQEGADLALEAACRNDGTFHGIAPHSGGRACTVSRPISTIAFGARGSLNYAANLAATQGIAASNGCGPTARAWKTFDGKTRDPICRSSKSDPRASLVPCSEVREAPLAATSCRFWEGCRNDTRVVFCDVAPNTEHGMMNAIADAQLVYSNNTLLNTPSVAWRFFQELAR